MACKNTYLNKQNKIIINSNDNTEDFVIVEPIFFGVDLSRNVASLLQNNLTMFEWICKNKIYPNYIGRNMNGENSLTVEEIDYIHRKGCKIIPVFSHVGEKKTYEQGTIAAKKADMTAYELGIPSRTAIYLEIDENEEVTAEFMHGFAKALIFEGYTPAFKANTDAKYDFDRQFSRGMQIDAETFGKCAIWAMSPSLDEYNNMTTTHLVHPDKWSPHAPSGIKRKDVSIWQYGNGCHPICTDDDVDTFFNLNLVKSKNVISHTMF